jgi:hypothetical protein
MTPTRIGGAFVGLAALATLFVFLPASARSQDQPPLAQASPAAAPAVAVPAAAAAPTGAAVHEMREEATKRSIAADVRKTLDNQPDASPSSGALGSVKAAIKKITPERLLRDKEFQHAAAEFPEFCHEWEQKLRERERNNISHLLFTLKDGWETATYTGYGKVESCEAHESKDGFAIGRLTYEEFIYYLTGKTEDDARQASPKTVSDTHTTEIFRWDRNQWFY